MGDVSPIRPERPTKCPRCGEPWTIRSERRTSFRCGAVALRMAGSDGSIWRLSVRCPDREQPEAPGAARMMIGDREGLQALVAVFGPRAFVVDVHAALGGVR